jgi:hypothetical protein
MMATRATVPMGMRRVFRRFERWRKSHTGRLLIPEHLWASAAELAREHGVFPTAKVLRLDYGKLKRMAESAGPMECSATAPTSFVELVAPSATGLSECRNVLSNWKGHAARCASSGKGPRGLTWLDYFRIADSPGVDRPTLLGVRDSPWAAHPSSQPVAVI